MKKLIFPVLLLATSYISIAQSGPTPEQKKVLFNKIDRLVTNYIKYSGFLEAGKSKVSANSLSDFRQLFISDAVAIPDEMSPAYFDKDKLSIQVPSNMLIEKEAARFKKKIPSFDTKYTTSISAMKRYSGELDNYLIGFDNERPAFYQAYTSLFKSVAEYFSTAGNQENIVVRKLPELLFKVEALYPDGFSVSMLNSAVSLKNIESNVVKVLLEKKIEGKISGAAIKLENHDTIVLTLKVSQNYSKVQIAGIEMIGHQFNFLNDKDRDFVADANDACPTVKGMFQPNGCPVADENNLTTKMDGFLSAWKADSAAVVALQSGANSTIKSLEGRIAFLEKKTKEPAHWWITIGVGGGAVTSKFTNADNGYLNNIRQNEINPASVFSGGKSFNGDVSLEHYFGNKPFFGISMGISYSSISGTIKKNGFHEEYQATDKNNNIYRQHITATEPIEEKIAIGNLNIPLMLVLKANISEKIAFKIEGGVAFNLSYSSKMSSTTGTFDYEAVYKYSGNNTTAFDAGQTPDKTSWIITKDFVANHIGASGVSNYFNGMQANNYPVGLGIKAFAGVSTGNTDASFGSGISLVLRPSLSFSLSKESNLSLGGFYSSSTLSKPGNIYRLTDENYQYNTLMEGVAKVSGSSFGVRLSYSHSLFYNLPKWIKELSGIR